MSPTLFIHNILWAPIQGFCEGAIGRHASKRLSAAIQWPVHGGSGDYSPVYTGILIQIDCMCLHRDKLDSIQTQTMHVDYYPDSDLVLIHVNAPYVAFQLTHQTFFNNIGTQ